MFLIQALAGGVSGIVNKTAIAPLERLKILYQVQGMDTSKPRYGGMVSALVQVSRQEGFLSLWKGNAANVARIVPNYGIKFAFNDMYKDWIRVPGQPMSFQQKMAAGTLAGLTQAVLTYPLELVRTRLSLAADFSRGAHYRGIWDCLRRTVQREGFPGLYKGIGPTIATGAPYTGLQMSTYELFKEPLKPHLDQTMCSLVAGALSGIVSQTLTYPGDTIRRRMQANGIEGQPRLYSNSLDCLQRVVSQEGVTGLFRGCVANTVRAIPGTAIQFWCFELVRSCFGVEPL